MGPSTFSRIMYSRAGTILQNRYRNITQINRPSTFIVCYYDLHSHWVYSITLSAWISEIWLQSKHKSKLIEDKNCFNEVKDNELKMLIYNGEKVLVFLSLVMDLGNVVNMYPSI